MLLNYRKQISKNFVWTFQFTTVIVRQRMCKSGMKWKDKVASAVLRLRSLTYSDGRWKILWSKINQYGF